jgi:hypothetical protein
MANKTFSLTSASPTSDTFTHKGGNLTILMDGTFDNGAIKFVCEANGITVQLTNDDFNVRTTDAINLQFASSINYYLDLQGAGGSADVNVTIQGA